MGFWRFWNPVFGYALGKYIYRPLVCQLPRPVAYILTFIACGLIHDAVTLLVKGSTHFLFGYWFLYMSIVALVASALNFRFHHRPFSTRVLTQICYLYLCYLMAFYSSRTFDLTGY